MKNDFSLIIVFFLLLLIGCTGSVSEKDLSSLINVQPNALSALERMKAENKFGEGASPFYPGAESKVIQKALNDLMNKSINDIISVIKTNPTKMKILQQYKVGLSMFDALNLDTEDREQVCDYYDKIREIIGFDSTHTVLNQWLYGALGKELKID